MGEVRPLYETPTDRRNEASVLAAAAVAWRCEALSLTKNYPVDAVFRRGRKAVAWGEVKCRSHEFGRYPSLILSARKVADAVGLGRVSGLPVFVLARFSDGVWWHRLVPPYDLDVGGRVDRGDAADIEPVFHLPVDGFRPLNVG